jgi:hypothetical protein
MTFEQVVDAHEAYLAKRVLPDAGEAAERIREFLELPPDEDAAISSDVRFLLVLVTSRARRVRYVRPYRLDQLPCWATWPAARWPRSP